MKKSFMKLKNGILSKEDMKKVKGGSGMTCEELSAQLSWMFGQGGSLAAQAANIVELMHLGYDLYD